MVVNMGKEKVHVMTVMDVSMVFCPTNVIFAMAVNMELLNESAAFVTIVDMAKSHQDVIFATTVATIVYSTNAGYVRRVNMVNGNQCAGNVQVANMRKWSVQSVMIVDTVDTRETAKYVATVGMERLEGTAKSVIHVHIKSSDSIVLIVKDVHICVGSITAFSAIHATVITDMQKVIVYVARCYLNNMSITTCERSTCPIKWIVCLGWRY